jgi:hypothetical protein
MSTIDANDDLSSLIQEFAQATGLPADKSQQVLESTLESYLQKFRVQVETIIIHHRPIDSLAGPLVSLPLEIAQKNGIEFSFAVIAARLVVLEAQRINERFLAVF